MKKLIVILFAMGLTTGVFAQKIIRGGGGFIRPRTVISVGAYAPFYPFGFSSMYGYPYYNYGYHNRPTKLDLQVADIKNDYNEKINAARDDKSISRSERRKIVRELKHDRDQDIIQAKRDYYKMR